SSPGNLLSADFEFGAIPFTPSSCFDAQSSVLLTMQTPCPDGGFSWASLVQFEMCARAATTAVWHDTAIEL
ncbi:MAG: hypothetical protein KAX73_05120, partial [Aquabacterium sp.]|nr:hypothetical protein [Aquabacterium sp.]